VGAVPDFAGSIQDQLEEKKSDLKALIYGCIKNRRFGAAADILGRYAEASPSDPDIKAIGGMIETALAEERGEAMAGGVKLPDKIAVLEGVETVFVLENLSTSRNGVINSVLNKVKFMEDRWGYSPMILVCCHNIELRRIAMSLRRAEKISSRTRVMGVYDYLQGSYGPGLENKAVFEAAKDGARRVETNEDEYDVYEGDVLARKEYFEGHNKSLRLVERMEGGKRAEGTYYDDWGYVNCVREYEPESGAWTSDSYYATDGRLCLKAFFRRVSEEDYETERIILYGRDGAAENECRSDAELAALCLEKIITDGKFHMVVIENGLMAEAAALLEKKTVAKAIVVHNKFLENAYDLRSGPQRFYKYLCENSEKFDGIVLLTHEARNDFFAKYGDIRRLFAIAHPYPGEVKRADFEKRDHRKAVIVARLDPFKQLPNAIEIFAEAVGRLPDIRLEIYGQGPEHEKCENKIKELGMENNVFLMGFADEPAAIFSSAALFMMTSSAEGFPLTLAESLCNGCPAFAFDIKYGPGEVITDGVTGYLVPPYDKDAYVDRLVSFLGDFDLQRQMSENAYDEAARFSPEVFLESWYRLTEALCGLKRRI
jgi:poly(glycerol-phosphate) alpha-glucosyltransferase